MGDYVDARFDPIRRCLEQGTIHDLYGDTISGSVTRMESLPVVHFLIYAVWVKTSENVWCMKFTDRYGKSFHKTMELVRQKVIGSLRMMHQRDEL